jgi:hypothetical protein
VLDPNHPEEPVKRTIRQLAYLRALAQRTGETFAYPQTRSEASQEIRRLKQRRPASRTERAVERRQVLADMQTRPRDATRVREDEVEGYGSNARWANGEDAQ